MSRQPANPMHKTEPVVYRAGTREGLVSFARFRLPRGSWAPSAKPLTASGAVVHGFDREDHSSLFVRDRSRSRPAQGPRRRSAPGSRGTPSCAADAYATVSTPPATSHPVASEGHPVSCGEMRQPFNAHAHRTGAAGGEL